MINNLLLNYMRRFPLEYGKRSLASLINLPGAPTEYENRFGVKFVLDTEEYQMKQIYLYDLYEKNTVRHLTKLVKSDFVFVDVGSNIGFYGLTFAKLLSRGYVHCFEPNRISFERLRHNLSLNGLRNVILNNVGLSDEEADLECSYNLKNTGTASIYKKPGSGTFKEMIHVIRMDDYCHAKGIDKIDFIKVDIEGGELSFLKGAEGVIRNSPKLVLVVEMMQENFQAAGYTSDYIFNYITGLGFEAFLPKSFPLGLRRINKLPADYSDNIIFLRGY